jgi:hypothetical protein
MLLEVTDNAIISPFVGASMASSTQRDVGASEVSTLSDMAVYFKASQEGVRNLFVNSRWRNTFLHGK